MVRLVPVLLFICLCIAPVTAGSVPSLDPRVGDLCRLWDGETKTVNALWGENPPERVFGNGRTKVVIADIKGPGVITMIHFAMPQVMKLDRQIVLRIYWDDEENPSVQAPLVDFFCDPNGALERVDSALVNKKRGWNCYFPMPFAKRARVEITSEVGRYPGGNWAANPCYSYVTYQTLNDVPKDAGYFHAEWRQNALLIGKEDYQVFEADGKGQFVGWNMTVRGVGSPTAGHPVDENVKFFADDDRYTGDRGAEDSPSNEWQGLEDAFGFSWGFPEAANGFHYTGYQPYYNGSAAYRFCVNDRICFRKSMRMTVGFHKGETWFTDGYSKPGSELEFSSVAYWYQKEPHKPIAAILPVEKRQPSMISTEVGKPEEPGQTLALNPGLMAEEVVYLKGGWDYRVHKGYAFIGPPWEGRGFHCWADYDSVDFDIICPKSAAGTLKLFIRDADLFTGGRKQSITVAGRMIGEFEGFQSGKWVDVPVTSADTSAGKITVVMKNLKTGANAVVSKIRFVEGQ